MLAIAFARAYKIGAILTSISVSLCRVLERLKMSDQAAEILITNAIHTAFIKYPEATAART